MQSRHQRQERSSELEYWYPLMFQPVSEYIELAQTIGELGFAGVGLADHVAIPEVVNSLHPPGANFFPPESEFLDPLVLGAAIAASTVGLKIVSYAYVLPMRHPLLAAKEIGTLAALFPGRFYLGVGAGWLTEEIASVGVDPRTRGARFDEMLQIMRLAWDRGWLEHHGEMFDFSRTAMFPRPAVAPPVWVGGRSEAALQRAVRNDGWLGMHYPVDEIESLVTRISQIRANAGDTRKDFEVFVIPDATPSKQLYEHLAGLGVTSTMVTPAPIEEPDSSPADQRRRQVEATARRIGLV